VRIQPVFHVSQLKPKLGQTSGPIPTIPLVDAHGILLPESMDVLARQFQKKNNRLVSELLVKWAGQPTDDATWEEFLSLKRSYPHLVGNVL